MKILLKKCLSIGDGWLISKSLVALVACCYSIFTNAQKIEFQSVGDWVVADSWPYMVQLESETPLMVVVEQRGVDLRVIKSDGSSLASPAGRSGPEFVYIAPGDEKSLRLEPVYTNVAKGSFRLHTVELTQPSILKLAQELDAAGTENGRTLQHRKLTACSKYDALAADQELDSNWRWIAAVLHVRCNFDTGILNTELQIDRLSDVLTANKNQEFYSLSAYHINWLQARHFNYRQDYEKAEAEYQEAIDDAVTLSSTGPLWFSDSITYDIGEMYSEYGNNGMMLSWKMGSESNEHLLTRSSNRILQSIAIGNDFQDSQILGNAYNNMAGLFFVKGDNFETIEYMKLSEAQLSQTGDIVGHNFVLGNMGDYYRRWGQLREAQNSYNKATANLSEASNTGDHGNLYQKLGSLNMLFLDYDAAIQNIQIAIEYHKTVGAKRSEHEALSQLATIYREQGSLLEARAARQTALEFFEVNNWTASALNAKAELSHDERLLGNIESAYQLSSSVVTELQVSGFDARVARIPIYTNYAELLFARGQHETAFLQLQAALLEIKQSGAEPVDEILLLSTLTELYQKAGETEEAMVVAEQNFDVIESQRSEFDTARLGPKWSARTNGFYSSHLEYLLQQEDGQVDYLELAFAVAERASAFSFRQRRQEMMLNNNETNSAARSEWVDIVSQLRDSKGEIYSGEDRLELEHRFNEAQERYFAAHGLSHKMNVPQILNSEEIRTSISENSLVLQYVTGVDKIWRFDLAKNHFSVTEIGNTQHVLGLIELALQDVKNPKVSKRANLRALSQTLLKDLSLDSAATELLISPASKLDTIPFSSLFYGQNYLSQIATLTMVPSISEYFVDRSSPVENDSQRMEIAVLADPAFEIEPQGVEINTLDDREQFYSWSSARERLPFSAKEARDLSQFFDEGERLILTGEDATKENFFSSEVREAKIIHIATHGYFNEKIPELVGLAMAKSSAADDGFVSLAEIATQKFTAELIVISACDTARGFDVPGEGALSLSRAFLAQGVGSVVSTLWPVSDAASAIFMKEFYRSLQEEELDPASSLQKAQLALQKNPRYRNASYWGAYVLTSAVQYTL